MGTVGKRCSRLRFVQPDSVSVLILSLRQLGQCGKMSAIRTAAAAPYAHIHDIPQRGHLLRPFFRRRCHCSVRTIQNLHIQRRRVGLDAAKTPLHRIRAVERPKQRLPHQTGMDAVCHIA